MEKQDNKIIFVDDKGLKTELNILFTYESKKFNKTYVLFYSDENPSEIIAGQLADEGEILDIEDDEEYDELDEVLQSYYEEHENK